MPTSGEAPWTAPTFHNLHADIADASDRVEQILFPLLLTKAVTTDLAEVREDITSLFGSAPDITIQNFTCAGGLEGLVIFDQALVNDDLLMPAMLDGLLQSNLSPADGMAPDLLPRVRQMFSPLASITGGKGSTAIGLQLGDLADHVLRGSAMLCFAGCRQAVALKIGKADKRSIADPPSAPAVMGPHEGFIEDAQTNLSLIRRRLRTPRLRVEQFHLGTISRTAVYLLHLHGITDDLVVAEARRRLEGVRIDGIMESGTLLGLISDAPKAPVPMMQRSERPDRVAGALLQGQIAIVTDGTPFVLLAPTTIFHLLKATEDYYENWVSVTLVRCIRIAAIMLGVFLPAFYVAIVTFHPEFIPPPLLTTIAGSRENVPLPSIGEVLLLLLLFEIIREAGVRVPKGIGNALTIGGTLVVGEAAVRAGIVSSPVIIITSAVVIAFFAIPDYDMVQFTRFLVYPMLFAAAFLGIFGLLFASFILAFYLTSLRSFGVSFLSPLAPMRPTNWGDAVVRAPWWAMDTRPAETGYTNPRRQPRGQRPQPPGGGS